jgi:alkanesulfonate monooxygenase SsuD/methylene tetrahydromethanopterin reductase-like flavin-dependent oxidoreductase (luciferase family)
MDIGTFLLMQSPSQASSQEIFSRGLEQAQAAEALGFRNCWLGEHHFSTYGYLSRPVQFATHIAAKTTKLRVGTAVIVIPLHNPLTVAEEIATLDLLSNGRADIGFGRGYQQYEFARFGLDLDTAREKYDEALDIVLKSFEGKPFSYSGKHYQLPETMIYPQPLQRPHPPVWIVAQSPYAVEAAVRRGFSVLTGGFGVTIEHLANYGKLYNEVCAKVQPKVRPPLAVQRAIYVAESAADARDAAEHARWNMRVTLSLRNRYEQVENGRAVPLPSPNEPDLDDLVERYLMIGTPERLIGKIKQLKDVMGITHFNCSFWFGDLDQKRVLRSMERFAREIMPAVV